MPQSVSSTSEADYLGPQLGIKTQTAEAWLIESEGREKDVVDRQWAVKQKVTGDLIPRGEDTGFRCEYGFE